MMVGQAFQPDVNLDRAFWLEIPNVQVRLESLTYTIRYFPANEPQTAGTRSASGRTNRRSSEANRRTPANARAGRRSNTSASDSRGSNRVAQVSDCGWTESVRCRSWFVSDARCWDAGLDVGCWL